MAEPLEWKKNKAQVRAHRADLAYLPRAGWDATLAAYAYAAAQARGAADLNVWATLNGAAASARYAALGPSAVVIWHGTSAARVGSVLEKGLRTADDGAVFGALDPTTSHSYTRRRAEIQMQAGQAGSAMLCLLFSREELEQRFHWQPRAGEVRIPARVPGEFVEYILWSDRVEFRGAIRASEPRPLGQYRFKKRGGAWVPMTKTPARFDGEHTYATRGEWLELAVRRVLGVLGQAAAVEVFAAVYAMVEPWEAVAHEEIIETLERVCGRVWVRGNRTVYEKGG
jgi:hypothetical protein